jgi:putative FmdB family regulatory protein
VPRYDFRCRVCDETFEVNRPMSAAGDPAACPEGHDDTVRLLSVFASVGGAPAPAAPAPARTGGGCGSGCGCHH